MASYGEIKLPRVEAVCYFMGLNTSKTANGKVTHAEVKIVGHFYRTQDYLSS